MRFTGLIKGDFSITGDISKKLAEHGCIAGKGWTMLGIDKVTTDKWGKETHFTVYGKESLEHAIHAWFQEPGEAPFPAGTLLHFAYQADDKRITTVKTYTYEDFLAEIDELYPDDSGAGDVGC